MPKLIGMVHLLPLPGSPGSDCEMDQILEHAVRDAKTLRDAGFDAIMIENFGDAPFTRGSIAPETVAAMAIAIREVRKESKLPVGVNCLRNDARSALGIAATVGAGFIRVNVLTGVAATDQGMIEGDAHRTLRDRQLLCPNVKIFADVHVKHAITVNQPDIALAAEETAYRGRADAIIV
ncbi:MAG: BtpA/SgcQ family protein, partial [Planctomycetes bacterium]|nr:BtpA/SgcQ family protein [Planctomycetota bacterium]